MEVRGGKRRWLTCELRTGSKLMAESKRVIARMNCFPFPVNVNKDAASSPIWMTHAWRNSGMKGVGQMKDSVLGFLHTCFLLTCFGVSQLSDEEVSTLGN
jgi:hypothetical protein